MTMNRQQKFQMVLEHRGFAVVKRGKYVVMGKDGFMLGKDGKPTYFYLGKSGSARIGKSQAKSNALSDNWKRLRLDEWEKLVPEF